MIWAFAVAAAATLYLALRFRQFRSWVEPVLTITVAIGLAIAILLWFVDKRSLSPEAGDETVPALTEETVALSDMQASLGQTRTSYRITGTVANKGDVPMQSFRLDVVLSDCPNGACREAGRDSALIVLRVLPGESLPFSTFVVFPGIDLNPVATPKFDFGARDVRAARR